MFLFTHSAHLCPDTFCPLSRVWPSPSLPHERTRRAPRIVGDVRGSARRGPAGHSRTQSRRAWVTILRFRGTRGAGVRVALARGLALSSEYWQLAMTWQNRSSHRSRLKPRLSVRKPSSDTRTKSDTASTFSLTSSVLRGADGKSEGDAVSPPALGRSPACFRDDPQAAVAPGAASTVGVRFPVLSFFPYSCILFKKSMF